MMPSVGSSTEDALVPSTSLSHQPQHSTCQQITITYKVGVPPNDLTVLAHLCTHCLADLDTFDDTKLTYSISNDPIKDNDKHCHSDLVASGVQSFVRRHHIVRLMDQKRKCDMGALEELDSLKSNVKSVPGNESNFPSKVQQNENKPVNPPEAKRQKSSIFDSFKRYLPGKRPEIPKDGSTDPLPSISPTKAETPQCVTSSVQGKDSQSDYSLEYTPNPPIYSRTQDKVLDAIPRSLRINPNSSSISYLYTPTTPIIYCDQVVDLEICKLYDRKLSIRPFTPETPLPSWYDLLSPITDLQTHVVSEEKPAWRSLLSPIPITPPKSPTMDDEFSTRIQHQDGVLRVSPLISYFENLQNNPTLHRSFSSTSIQRDLGLHDITLGKFVKSDNENSSSSDESDDTITSSSFDEDRGGIARRKSGEIPSSNRGIDVVSLPSINDALSAFGNFGRTLSDRVVGEVSRSNLKIQEIIALEKKTVPQTPEPEPGYPLVESPTAELDRIISSLSARTASNNTEPSTDNIVIKSIDPTAAYDSDEADDVRIYAYTDQASIDEEDVAIPGINIARETFLSSESCDLEGLSISEIDSSACTTSDVDIGLEIHADVVIQQFEQPESCRLNIDLTTPQEILAGDDQGFDEPIIPVCTLDPLIEESDQDISTSSKSDDETSSISKIDQRISSHVRNPSIELLLNNPPKRKNTVERFLDKMDSLPSADATDAVFTMTDTLSTDRPRSRSSSKESEEVCDEDITEYQGPTLSVTVDDVSNQYIKEISWMTMLVPITPLVNPVTLTGTPKPSAPDVEKDEDHEADETDVLLEEEFPSHENNTDSDTSLREEKGSGDEHKTNPPIRKNTVERFVDKMAALPSMDVTMASNEDDIYALDPSIKLDPVPDIQFDEDGEKIKITPDNQGADWHSFFIPLTPLLPAFDMDAEAGDDADALAENEDEVACLTNSKHGIVIYADVDKDKVEELVEIIDCSPTGGSLGLSKQIEDQVTKSNKEIVVNRDSGNNEMKQRYLDGRRHTEYRSFTEYNNDNTSFDRIGHSDEGHNRRNTQKSTYDNNDWDNSDLNLGIKGAKGSRSTNLANNRERSISKSDKSINSDRSSHDGRTRANPEVAKDTTPHYLTAYANKPIKRPPRKPKERPARAFGSSTSLDRLGLNTDMDLNRRPKRQSYYSALETDILPKRSENKRSKSVTVPPSRMKLSKTPSDPQVNTRRSSNPSPTSHNARTKVVLFDKNKSHLPKSFHGSNEEHRPRAGSVDGYEPSTRKTRSISFNTTHTPDKLKYKVKKSLSFQRQNAIPNHDPDLMPVKSACKYTGRYLSDTSLNRSSSSPPRGANEPPPSLNTRQTLLKRSKEIVGRSKEDLYRLILQSQGDMSSPKTSRLSLKRSQSESGSEKLRASLSPVRQRLTGWGDKANSFGDKAKGIVRQGSLKLRKVKRTMSMPAESLTAEYLPDKRRTTSTLHLYNSMDTGLSKSIPNLTIYETGFGVRSVSKEDVNRHALARRVGNLQRSQSEVLKTRHTRNESTDSVKSFERHERLFQLAEKQMSVPVRDPVRDPIRDSLVPVRAPNMKTNWAWDSGVMSLDLNKSSAQPSTSVKNGSNLPVHTVSRMTSPIYAGVDPILGAKFYYGHAMSCDGNVMSRDSNVIDEVPELYVEKETSFGVNSGKGLKRGMSLPQVYHRGTSDEAGKELKRGISEGENTVVPALTGRAQTRDDAAQLLRSLQHSQRQQQPTSVSIPRQQPISARRNLLSGLSGSLSTGSLTSKKGQGRSLDRLGSVEHESII